MDSLSLHPVSFAPREPSGRSDPLQPWDALVAEFMEELQRLQCRQADLQLGERHLNFDFLFTEAWLKEPISYDLGLDDIDDDGDEIPSLLPVDAATPNSTCASCAARIQARLTRAKLWYLLHALFRSTMSFRLI
ncbi:hypothetical protein B0H11DRAFT_2240139 [Mycena galericulata]|nr:hypothetical protein B0H11DRAFT_2240139 [Mycena galericulata]